MEKKTEDLIVGDLVYDPATESLFRYIGTSEGDDPEYFLEHCFTDTTFKIDSPDKAKFLVVPHRVVK